MAAQAGTRRGPALVNKQFNSPIKLYSPENVAEVLNKQTQVLENGAVGIDFQQLSAPGHLANSAVLRMLAEEERQRGGAIKEESPTSPSSPSPPPLTPAAEASEAQGAWRAVDGKATRGLRRWAWPPQPHGVARGVGNETLKHPLLSSARFPVPATQGLKRVAWPPPPDSDEGNFVDPQAQPVFSKLQGSFPGAGQIGQPQHPPIFEQPLQFPSYQAPSAPVAAAPASAAPAPYAPPPFQPPPATVALRPQPPISQEPFPVFESQPAATRAAEPKMRGDEKWPPTEYKARAAAENEQRLALARGPAVRPRKVKRDYSNFFAQHALTPNYPSYRPPPGTQHFVEEGTSNF